MTPDTPRTEELEARLQKRLSRATRTPWELQDSCSWRRIGTAGHSGNVLCPSYYSDTDRHLDLSAGKGEDLYANLELIVDGINALPDLLATIQALRSQLAEKEAEIGRLREASAMAIAEMMRASGRLEIIATCNEDRRISAALQGTCDFIRTALTKEAGRG